MSLTLSQFLESLPLPAFATTPDGVIAQGNTALHDMLGYESLAGRALADLAPQGDTAAEDLARQALQGSETPQRYLKEFTGADGRLHACEVHPGGLRDDAGALTHALFVLRPLSEEMLMLEKLQRSHSQLLASSEVSRAATQILDVGELLTKCVDLIRVHFGFYYAAIFLIDEDGQAAVLKAATGEGGQQLLAQGHSLAVGSNSMVGWVTANDHARIALDVGEEAVRFDNPVLPKTRSEMALPLRARGRVIGALDAQSTALNAFSDEDIKTIQMMADQVAIAIDNARLFAQLNADA